MKQFISSLICTVVLAVTAQATVTLELEAGFLKNATGTQAVPVGGLLQLIATPSGVASGFAAPTATSFTGGDNVIVASFDMNYKGGIGDTDNLLTFTLANTGVSSATTFDAGDPLILRWYPSLTYSASTDYTKIGPGLAVNYGQGRSTTNLEGGAAWVTPANSTSATILYFFTTDDGGGSQPIVNGYATNLTLIPEPTTNAMIFSVMLGFVGWRFRRRTS